MFSFLEGVFNTTNEEASIPAQETVVDLNHERNPVPQVMDFTGADKIVVIRTDYTQPVKPTTRQEIVDPETVAKIISILTLLPKQGQEMRRMTLSVVHKAVAYRNGMPFAYIEFYAGALKTEDTSFYGANEAVRENESVLFNLISS